MANHSSPPWRGGRKCGGVALDKCFRLRRGPALGAAGGAELGRAGSGLPGRWGSLLLLTRLRPRHRRHEPLLRQSEAEGASAQPHRLHRDGEYPPGGTRPAAPPRAGADIALLGAAAASGGRGERRGGREDGAASSDRGAGPAGRGLPSPPGPGPGVEGAPGAPARRGPILRSGECGCEASCVSELVRVRGPARSRK